MPVTGAQDFINDVAVVGEEDKPFGILIEPAYREDALPMVDCIDDIGLVALVSSAGDSGRLVIRNVDRSLFFADRLTIYLYHIAGCHTVSGNSHMIINRNPPFIDIMIC